MTNDEKVKNVLSWTINNAKYVSDSTQFNKPEFWQYAHESFASMKGDCEDMGILMYKLCRNLGIPAFRLKLCCGDVIDPNTRKTAGHCYLIYLSEVWNQWFLVDWCFYSVLSYNALYDTPHSGLGMYKDIWFTFNESESWNEKDIVI